MTLFMSSMFMNGFVRVRNVTRRKRCHCSTVRRLTQGVTVTELSGLQSAVLRGWPVLR